MLEFPDENALPVPIPDPPAFSSVALLAVIFAFTMARLSMPESP
jgi:hypothetical protein